MFITTHKCHLTTTFAFDTITKQQLLKLIAKFGLVLTHYDTLSAGNHNFTITGTPIQITRFLLDLSHE